MGADSSPGIFKMEWDLPENCVKFLEVAIGKKKLKTWNDGDILCLFSVANKQLHEIAWRSKNSSAFFSWL